MLKGKNILFAVVILLIFSSCRTTKYIPDDKYLLSDYKVKEEKKVVKKEELESFVKQKPNKKILFFKFHLGLYNLSDPDKDNGFNNWLRRIGEEPVIYDEFLAQKTEDQLRLYLKIKGYFDARVSDTVFFKNQKASVIYDINPGEPYLLENVEYIFEDSSLEDVILPDTVNSLIKKGIVYDEFLLDDERTRIQGYLKSKGYYKFSEKNIYYSADSTLPEKKIDLDIVITKFREIIDDGNISEKEHAKYRIRNVYFNTNYKPGDFLSDQELYNETLDTLSFDNNFIVFPQEQNVKPDVIIESSHITPGELYNNEDSRRTYRDLSSLDLFRMVNINYEEREGINDNDERMLDCNILLTPQKLQSLFLEPEITNSSGNIGAAGNLIYQHRNLFKGAESLNMRLKGAFETLKESYREDFGNMVEFGADLGIDFPKFLLPFKNEEFIRKYNPKTSISIAYNYQRRPDYTRTLANAKFGYNWKGNKFLTHVINPVELNLVKIPYKSQEFIDWIDGKYIEFSYQPHLISVTNYSLIYNNQNIQKNTDFIYFRTNLESAGNLLNNAYNWTGAEKVDGHYELFNTRFAQYIRGDFDFRYYNVIDENSSLVYRLFAGAGLPYKNSEALPFEKKYFSGGSNSIRAWQVRNLGPGSYKEEDVSLYPNKTADIKLEANLEYRFDLFWLMEGALFVDAGNIWAINESDERAGALFKWDSFFNDIAIGTGFGTRFDFSFFIFRLDLGIKMRDPVMPVGEKWLPGNRKYTNDDFTINIGIGYPF